MSIPLEHFVSEETIWDFDVSTVPGILNAPEPGLIKGMEKSLGYNSSPTMSIPSSAQRDLRLRQCQAAQTQVR